MGLSAEGQDVEQLFVSIYWNPSFKTPLPNYNIRRMAVLQWQLRRILWLMRKPRRIKRDILPLPVTPLSSSTKEVKVIISVLKSGLKPD